MAPAQRGLEERLRFAAELGREVGAFTQERFLRKDLAIDVKSDGSPVTEADRDAERLMRARIGAAFPDDGILGEEYGEEPGNSGARWVLDPIDGTVSFARGVPLYGNLIGLEQNGEAVLGVIGAPAAGELVYGALGLGAHWERRGETVPARVSSVARASEGMLLSTCHEAFVEAGQPELFARLREDFRSDRGWSDCYGHLLVATGRAEAMIDPVMALWDSCALLPIVLEAGGRFFDLAGEPTHASGSAISCNAALGDELRRLVGAALA